MVFAPHNICHLFFTIVSGSPMFPIFSVVIHVLIVLCLSIRCELLVVKILLNISFFCFLFSHMAVLL